MYILRGAILKIFFESYVRWSSFQNIFLNPIQDGLFRGCSLIGVGQKAPPPLPKICHTYLTMVKLGSYTSPKEDPEIYESHDTLLEFC